MAMKNKSFIKWYGLLGGLTGALLVSISLNVFLYLKSYYPTYLVGLVDIFNESPVYEKGDHFQGKPGSQLVIIEYSDYLCPYCRVLHGNLRKYLRLHGGSNILWIKRHTPLSSHKMAYQAAIASECAADYEKFWSFSDFAYQNQTKIRGVGFLRSLPEKLGINRSLFKKCLKDPQKARLVNEDMLDSKRRGIITTPTYYVNGTRYSGALPYDQLESLLLSELN